jgi:hypothetical protein
MRRARTLTAAGVALGLMTLLYTSDVQADHEWRRQLDRQHRAERDALRHDFHAQRDRLHHSQRQQRDALRHSWEQRRRHVARPHPGHLSLGLACQVGRLFDR